MLIDSITRIRIMRLFIRLFLKESVQLVNIGNMIMLENTRTIPKYSNLGKEADFIARETGERKITDLETIIVANAKTEATAPIRIK